MGGVCACVCKNKIVFERVTGYLLNKMQEIMSHIASSDWFERESTIAKKGALVRWRGDTWKNPDGV